MDFRTIIPANVTTNARIFMIVAQIMTLSVEEEAEVSERCSFEKGICMNWSLFLGIISLLC